MIERMKKVSVLVKNSDRIPSLRTLRSAGVVHVNTFDPVKSDEIERNEKILVMIERVIQAIQVKKDEETEKDIATFTETLSQNSASINDVLHFSREIDALLQKRREIEERTSELNSMEAVLEGWGDFSPAHLEFLHDNGITVIPAEIPSAELKELEQDDIQYILLKHHKKNSFIACINAREDSLPDTVTLLPRYTLSLREIQEQLALSREQIDTIDGRLAAETGSLPVVEDAYEVIASEHKLKVIQESMHTDGPVSWLTGFIPETETETLVNIAKENCWGLLVEDPIEEDPVPTKLKNNWLVRMIQPVFNLLGTVPGYREFDVSTFFLLFFTVFVAMIIGDAGYGLVFLGTAVFLHIRKRKTDELIRLVYVLGLSTIIWGGITGTWFSSEYLAQLPFLSWMVIPEIASFPEIFNVDAQTASETVMYICFVLGILQLSLASVINFIRTLPRLSSVAHLGWLALFIGLYLLSLNLVLGKTFPDWGMYVLAAGLGLIVLFGKQEIGQSVFKGVLKGFSGLFTTFLDSISAFSNIISYIRLFAVGMSSVAIASSFNSIAAGMPGGIGIAAAVLVLLFGHMLNILMGLLSVVVHGVRLNMLEFSGQLGMEWSGFPYHPVSEYKSRYFADSLQ